MKYLPILSCHQCILHKFGYLAGGFCEKSNKYFSKEDEAKEFPPWCLLEDIETENDKSPEVKIK